MRSKLSGLRQVYAVLTNDFSRPIETPIHDLRPARETCEKCHWPEKFYARQLINEKHYLTDSVNTEWNIGLQMKTGPSHSAQGLSEGIHWHINPNVKIEYIPKRDNRLDIPWVKYTNQETNEETDDDQAENTDGQQTSGPGSSSPGAGAVGKDTDQPPDIPDGSDDEIVARQLREAAEKETDPELKAKLWEEYRRYKLGTK